ncbi:MAG: cobalamin-binding protein [Gammaproteobacteria bacterium]|nr:cobalamin-binding protein [Gammaproteobacteria bacterium]
MKFTLLLIAILISLPTTLLAEIVVTDDAGTVLTLDKTATRVVSLSPGLTEMLFAAGGGEYIKGVVSYSDYPEEAKALPQVGGYNNIDIETIVSMKPDLVVSWKSGNPPLQISKLQSLGLNVFISEMREFDDIPRTLTQLGTIMGTESHALKAAKEFTTQLNALRAQYNPENTQPKSVYIQIWNDPLMSINGDHLISRIVGLCNGKNIFQNVQTVTITLDAETIIKENPDAIIATREGEQGEQWLSRWRGWPFLKAVKQGELYMANPDHLVRHTPRIINGIKQVCGMLQAAH